jgi:mono/diheme cytochrome c family protein
MVMATLLLVACTEEQSTASDNGRTTTIEIPARDLSDPRIKVGRQLYLKNCTVCHGINAEGAPDWRQRDKDGKFPAPPLNGTGHAWHHPKQALIYTIKNGTQALGGNMPAWKDRLTDEEIESIILWFQSKWPEELYQAWVRQDKASQQAK